jgi:aspartyl-tRNA synthetase
MFLIHSLDGQQTLMKNYFLIFQGNFNKEELGQIISAIETIESVLNINEIKLLSTSKKVSAALKKKLALLNAILNDLEYHMIDVGRKRTEQTVQLKKKTGSIKKLYKG